MSLPLQQDASFDDPENAFAWALVSLPGDNINAPLIVRPETLRAWSKRLYQCGLRFHPELQEIEYVPPPSDHNWMLGSAGYWTDIGAEKPPEVTSPDISHLSIDEKQVLFERLAAEFSQEKPLGDFAEVIE